MRSFRLDRVAKIAADETPVPLQEPCRLVLHVVPLSHFDLGPTLSMTEVGRVATHFSPIDTREGGDFRLNIDGFLTFSNPVKGQHRAYTQVFRSGAVEAVESLSSPKILINFLDRAIVQHTRGYAMALNGCGAESPFVVTASLLGVHGKMIGAQGEWQFRGQPADRDQLHLVDVVLDEVPDGNPRCGLALRPMLDQLANAAGLTESVSFDHKGNWQGG